MDLNTLRNDINDLDNQLLKLFVERMDICRNVALYKQEHGLPIFQEGRECDIINRIRGLSPEGLENSTEVLFKNIMDISKCKQQQEFFKDNCVIETIEFPLKRTPKVGCQGTLGAYSHLASQKIFGDLKVSFYHEFEKVFQAVENGEIDFGILPIQNSTAGSVAQTYDLMRKYNFYISTTTSIRISHCLAIKKGTKFSDVKEVYSHEQGLAQCSEFIDKSGLVPVSYINTAMAGELVAESDLSISAICSEECATRLGLEIVRNDITNVNENYTRFICISKEIHLSKDANIISVSLALPHTSGALYRLLTKFSVVGLNLLRIESKPIASKDFSVVFYLDFEGSITQPEVSQIIAGLKSELEFFKFLGNYSEVK